MAKDHGAKQQKKAAKHKAKRARRRSSLFLRTSLDPTVRLRGVSKLPVAQAFCVTELWTAGIGYLAIARQETESGLIYGVFLVDVFCLGVKDALWSAGSAGEFKEMLAKLEERQTFVPVTPACLAKIVTGAVEFAASLGFSPHPDYRHVARLLDGIDPGACPEEFTYGRDGKPFYIQGQYESPAQAEAIARRVAAAGGHYVTVINPPDPDDLDRLEDEWDDFDTDDEDDGFGKWR
jgi:hypothetical protein